MIFHYPAPWKNTIAFCILFDVRGLGIHETHEGLLHVAEHLMFIETKKYSENELYEKHSLLFDTLHAHTSSDFLTIDVVCARSDFRKVCGVLKEMVYSWKCNKKQFAKEQEKIIEEIKNSLRQPNNKTEKTLKKYLGQSDVNVIGNIKKIKSLTYSELKEIRTVWKKMLNSAPRNVLVASQKLTKSERAILEKSFDLKKYFIQNKSAPPIPMAARFISLHAVTALVVDTRQSSPFFLILQRLYYVRSVRQNLDWIFSFDREPNQLIYMIHKSTGEKLDASHSARVLLDTPTSEEFATAKDIIVKHIDSLIDGINPQEVIAWLDIFYLQDMSRLKEKTLVGIGAYFKAYEYRDFREDWETIFTLIEKT